MTPLKMKPRTLRFSQEKIYGRAPEDSRCLHLMHRGQMAALRSFHAKQAKA